MTEVPEISKFIPASVEVVPMGDMLATALDDPKFRDQIAGETLSAAVARFMASCQLGMRHAVSLPHYEDVIERNALAVIAHVMARSTAACWAVEQFREEDTEVGSEKERQAFQASMLPELDIDIESPKSRLIGATIGSALAKGPVPDPMRVLMALAEALHHEDPAQRTFTKAIWIGIQGAIGLRPTTKFMFYIENSEYHVEWHQDDQPVEFTHGPREGGSTFQ